MVRFIGATLCLLGLGLLSLSCTDLASIQDVPSYRSSIRKLQARLISNPNDADARCDLGVIYFQMKDFPRAEGELRRALDQAPKDPKALFYLGMSLENQDKRDSALVVFLNYDDVPSSSPYAALMEGRYRHLTRDIIQQQFQTLLKQENTLSEQAISPTTVAVYPLVFKGTDERFAALGKGLSEMILIDLAQVKSLNVVERIRIEALLDELKFAESTLVDPATAPRLGKLLKAGRMVTGAYTVSGKNILRLDVSLWDVMKRKFPDGTVKSDAAENLFKMEKELVFSIIGKLGIRLTPREREKIQSVPTQSLQAFLAYSIGLEKEDEGDYRAASVYFDQAFSLDPAFSRAKSKADELKALGVAGGNTTEAYAAAQVVEPPILPDPKGPDLLTDRLRKLGAAVQSSFVPGEDDRKSAQEASETGVVFRELPKPPRPPGQ